MAATSCPATCKEPIGVIKAFAWPLLLQAAGLIQRQGSKSALSPAGRKALGAAPATVLRTLWQKWLKATLLDEFSRVDIIKGQKAQGRVMAAVAPRRQAIESALKDCPVGAWIEVDQLSRYMMAAGKVFELTHDPWKLYILDAKYGSLGYEGSHGWDVLQLRYLLCLLFEYAAPLGLVDMAYVPPHEARGFGSDMWGTDELPFLSRYDGLCHICLTPPGAYCLGLADTYAAAAAPAPTRLSVMPSLQVHVAAGPLAKEEALMLETWASPLTADSWQLDRQKALAAVESGHDTADLHAFLQARDEHPLPQPVEAFLATTQKQDRALRIAGTAVLVECQDAATAATLAVHKETAGLCLDAGDRHVVVRSEHQAKFRSAARVLGFGMPPG
ncbi:MAG TPA: helicase-associated domain-containing protein [Burkholderiaceae bacterium]|nr:helicase-associated domain-containing protein [Burkholderiaceae bacterium]